MPLTSSGSMSLNSMPRPVQAMKWELDGSSSKATRNCQSWSEPLRWYDGPSRYRPDSCLMSPTQQSEWLLFHRIIGIFFHFKSHSGTHLPPSQAPRRCRRRSASPLCQTCNLENKTNKRPFEAKSHSCTITTSTRIIVGTFSPVSVSQIAVLP